MAYDIEQLNDLHVQDLQQIADSLGVPQTNDMTKENLVTKIIEQQSATPEPPKKKRGRKPKVATEEAEKLPPAPEMEKEEPQQEPKTKIEEPAEPSEEKKLKEEKPREEQAPIKKERTSGGKSPKER